MAVASILSGDTVTGQGRQGVVALEEGHAMYLISTVRKPAGAVTPGGLLSVAVFRRHGNRRINRRDHEGV